MHSCQFIFRQVMGVWRRVDSPSNSPATILADFLLEIGLCVPDYTQFLRVIEPSRCIEYRAYSGTIRINITLI